MIERSENFVPKISVVTPTKNRRLLLEETMASVAAQTLANWEHVIVDDGSNDRTEEYLREQARSDARIRYIQRASETSGANVCRNLGWQKSLADLIVFLDSDDLLAPEALERRLAWMSRNVDLDFVVFRTGAFIEKLGDVDWWTSGEIVGDDLLKFLSFDTPWQTSAPTWRRGALERLGGFDETLPSWQDVDLHIRAVASGLCYLRRPEIDHFMRWQNEPGKLSVAQRQSPDHLDAAMRLFEKFHTVVQNGPGMTWTRRRALCGLYFFVAERWIDIGRLGDALACWRTAREKQLAPAQVYYAGATLLALDRQPWLRRLFAERLTNKWKGWVRLRNEPDLVSG